jgi:isochorismatase family protein
VKLRSLQHCVTPNSVTDPYTRPLPASAALVLIDVQRDFYAEDAPLRIEGTSEAIPAMARLATGFRERALPIVHVVRPYRADGSNADKVRKQSIEQGARIAFPGSVGSQIAPALLPNAVELDHELLLRGDLQQVGPGEHVMYKPRWGPSTRPHSNDIFAILAATHRFSSAATSLTALGHQSMRRPNARPDFPREH